MDLILLRSLCIDKGSTRDPINFSAFYKKEFSPGDKKKKNNIWRRKVTKVLYCDNEQNRLFLTAYHYRWAIFVFNVLKMHWKTLSINNMFSIPLIFSSSSHQVINFLSLFMSQNRLPILSLISLEMYANLRLSNVMYSFINLHIYICIISLIRLGISCFVFVYWFGINRKNICIKERSGP